MPIISFRQLDSEYPYSYDTPCTHGIPLRQNRQRPARWNRSGIYGFRDVMLVWERGLAHYVGMCASRWDATLCTVRRFFPLTPRSFRDALHIGEIRVDYIGIGWLISASVGTVVYYGFSCHSQAALVYMSLCVVTGVAGTIFPFMSWFNDRR